MDGCVRYGPAVEGAGVVRTECVEGVRSRSFVLLHSLRRAAAQ